MVGGSVTLTATAAVTGGRIVSYQWSGEGNFSGSGSEVTWRAPGPPVATDYVLSVTVTDNDGATASDSVSIRVGANSAPTLSVEADVYTVHPDEVVTLTATAADDGRIVSYRWSGGYAGFADVDTGNTTWTAPDTVDPTNYVLSLTVTDDDGATASDSVSIRVARNRRPSVKLTAADYAIDTGETVTLTADARDSDGTIVSYVWSDRASRGEFSEPATGATVDWTAPSPTESTTYTLEVKVTDDDGGFKVDQVEVRVSPPEPAPPTPPAPPRLTGWAVSSVSGDGPQTFDVNVTTAGFGTLVPGSFEWSGTGLFSDTTVNANGTGTIVWTPPRVDSPYYETVSVRVTDNEGGTASGESPQILVKRSDSPNSEPTVRVSASATEIDGGDEITLNVTATDSDGTIESYTWRASPNRGSFGTMASDGDITWTAPVRHSERTYKLTVAVKDNAGGVTEKSTTITVRETPNHPPLLDVLSVSGATSTDTGFETGLGHNVGLHTYHYDANGSLKPGASDPDGTIESYEWSAVPEGGSFRNTGTPGVARWIAPTEVGQYVVTATAIDDDGGTASASETFRVVVRETNAAPTVALEAHATTVAGGAVVRLTASANDRDGTIESYTWSGEGTFTARGAEGKSPRVDWTAPSADGDYQLTVRVTDNAGGTATDSVVITVTGTDNIAPTVRLSASSRRIEAGGETSLTASAEDTDGTIASYAWSEENDAGTFTARGPMDQSARVDWTAPSPDADSEYTLSVTVTDNEGGTASATVEVTVGNAGNEPPTVSLTAAETEVEAGEKIRLTASATDDGTISSYEWSGKGAFNTTRTKGVVDWIAPSPAAETAYELKVTVIDSGGASASATVTVTVGAAANPLPMVIVPASASAAEGETTTIELSVTERPPSGASIGYRIGDETERARTEGSERGVGACRDYEHKSGTLSLGGKSSATLEIRPLPDACPGEPEEFVYIELFDPVEVTLDADTLPVSISDVHSKMGLVDSRASTEDGNLLPLSVAEGKSLSVTIERDIDVPGRRVPTSVEVQLVATGGAVAGEDYEDPGPQTVSFSASQARRTVSFRALDDDLHEQAVDEGFEIHLGNPKGGLLVARGTPGKTTLLPVVIEDTDGVREEILVSVRALTPTVTEGETARCEVKVEEAGGRRLDTGIRVRFQATDAGIENKDEWFTFGRAASQTRQVDVETIATRANENRAFNCRVGPADYSGSYELEITEGSAEVRIENINVENQPGDAPVWAFNQRTGERTLHFDARLNGELPDALTGTGKDPLVVSWTTSAGDDATAIAAVDYTASSGIHTFHPGAATSFRISIPITCDSADEDEEHFYVTATGARTNGAAVGGTSKVKITIVPEPDSCGGTKKIVSIADASAIEGEQMEFRVSVPTALDHDLLIDYATEQVSNSARAGEDFEAATGTVTIHRIHNTTAAILIQTLSDDIRDERETFRVRVSNARTQAGAVAFADAVATGTIVEQNAIGVEFRRAPATHNRNEFVADLHVTAELEATAAQVAEALVVEGADIEVQKAAALIWRITVRPTRAGNVTIGLDHTAVTGKNGRTVSPVDPIVVYGQSTVSIEDAEASESAGIMRFRVSLDAPAEADVTVRWRTSDGTAVNGQDYEAASGGHTFKAGETKGKVHVKIFATTEQEEDETFTVTLESTVGKLYIDPEDNTATGTIKDDSLGAQFIQPATARTDGSNFTVGLRFHPPVENVDLARLQQSLQMSSGSQVASVTKKAADDDQNFVVTIDPDGTKHVRIILPYGAVVGNRVMQYDASAWILGPVSITISDASGTEGTDSHLQFSVTLNQEPRQDVSVDYATEDDTATAGVDDTAVSGTLTFGPTETRKTIDVPVLDDDVDEAEELFKVKLSNAAGATISDGEGIGTIKNHDALPIALIARFGRATASHIVDQVETRIEGPPERAGLAVDLRGGALGPTGNGLETLPGSMSAMHPDAGGSDGNSGSLYRRGPTRRSMNGMSSRMDDDPLAAAGLRLTRERGGGTISIWTQSAQSSFSGRQGHIALGGDVRTRTLGADYRWDRMITGVALAHSVGIGEYDGVTSGEVRSSVTGLYPWIGYRATERITVWGVAGYGAGRMILTAGGGPQESGMSMAMAAGGTRGELVSSPGLDLAFKADALWVGTSIAGSSGPNGNLAAAHAGVTRMRTGIEGSRSYTLMERLALKPVIEVGLRRDGGDAETGAGIDVGAGLVVTDAASGLAVDMRMRTLLVHQAEEFRERGVAVTVSYNPTSTPYGLNARIAPAWGASAMGSAETLWRGDAMRGFGYQAGRRLEGEIGYGLAAGRFVGTPRFGFSTATFGRTYQLGYRITAAEAGDVRFELGVDLQRSESAHLPGANHGGMGRTRVSW